MPYLPADLTLQFIGVPVRDTNTVNTINIILEVFIA